MTSKDLLSKLLDYKAFWDSPDRKNSIPAKARIAQIQSLMDALGVSKDKFGILKQLKISMSGEKWKLDRIKRINSMDSLDYLYLGEFIHDKDQADYAPLIEKVRSSIRRKFSELPDEMLNRGIHLQWMYQNLISFRLGIHKMAFERTGFLEGFELGVQFSFELQNEFKSVMIENLGEIDEVLAFMIDPQQRKVNPHDIKYPEFDFNSLDLEWRMEDL